MLGQVQLYTDTAKRLIIAKAMEVAYVHNMRANLKYYENRTKSTYLKDGIKKLSVMITEINEAKSTEGIMLYEARARQIYYDMFNEIIQDENFRFSSRTRRPPKDPLNALISLGNTYLYNRIATEIEKSPLDIRIGIVHATTSRRQTLNLDIADIFKPLIVDRVIFTLINKNMIDVDKDFCINENGGVYMSHSGKRMFINQLDEKMYRKVSDGSINSTFDFKIREEINKIYRMVMYGEKYKPYKYY